MSNNGEPPPVKAGWVGLQLSESRIRLKPKTWFGMACVVGIFLAPPILSMLSVTDSFWHGAAQTTLGVLAGLFFAPTPNPVDHRAAAHVAMQRISDIYFNVDQARRTLTEIAEERANSNDSNGAQQVIYIQNLLLAQEQEFARSMSDWEEIVPGTKESVIAKTQLGHQMLEELSKEHSHGRV